MDLQSCTRLPVVVTADAPVQAPSSFPDDLPAVFSIPCLSPSPTDAMAYASASLSWKELLGER